MLAGQTESKFTNIRVMWGLVCSLSSIDQEKNNISLFDVINQLNVAHSDLERVKSGGHKGLVINYKHELVIMLRRMGHSSLNSTQLCADLKVSLFSPKGEIIAEWLTPVAFPPNMKNNGARISIDSFLIGEEGEHEYRVSVMEQGKMEFTDLYTIPLSVERVGK